jgi:hypothetical protein
LIYLNTLSTTSSKQIVNKNIIIVKVVEKAIEEVKVKGFDKAEKNKYKLEKVKSKLEKDIEELAHQLKFYKSEVSAYKNENFQYTKENKLTKTEVDVIKLKSKSFKNEIPVFEQSIKEVTKFL